MIEIKNLTKKYGSKKVVDNISFTLMMEISFPSLDIMGLVKLL